MSAFIIFACTGLLVYWVFRVTMLLYGSDDEINETLESDLWRGRRLLLGLRSMFVPPNQLAG